MHTMYFDDFAVGQRFHTRGVTITQGEAADFALKYDPQPIHVDKVAAERGPYGGLIASGLQTLSLTLRLFIDLGLVVDSGLGGPGFDELRWTAPVRAGDTLRVTAEVRETKPSASRPDRGLIRILFTTMNQDDTIVMTFQALMFIRRRPTDT